MITLASGGTYTVQPATNGIGFDPPNVVVMLSANRSGVDFTANPVLLSISPTNQPIKLTLLGVPSRTYNVQATTNLNSTNLLWQIISTNTADANNGLSELLDQTATNSPARISRSIADRACVSTSAVWKILETPVRRMSGS